MCEPKTRDRATPTRGGEHGDGLRGDRGALRRPHGRVAGLAAELPARGLPLLRPPAFQNSEKEEEGDLFSLDTEEEDDDDEEEEEEEEEEDSRLVKRRGR